MFLRFPYIPEIIKHAFRSSQTSPRRRRNRLRKRHRRPVQRAEPRNIQHHDPPNKLKKRPRPLSLPDERALQNLLANHQTQISSLDRRVHTAELETFRERLDKEMIIGELQDAQTTGAQERSSRRLLEEQIQGISRVVEGLEFDAGVDAGDHNAGESSSNGGSSSNHTSLPRRLRLIRARVQAMESNRQTSFNEIGDLERELDDMRETFTERELEWWEQKKRTRNYEFWLQTLQLEYGMTLWRHRGLELELLSTHRDIETLYARIESFPNGDLAQRLFEAEQTNSRIYEYLEAQQTHIVKLEVESSGLRGRLKEMEYALQQQHSRVPAYLKKIEEVVENREGAYRRLRELEGQSLKPSRSMTPEACSEYKGQTVQNLSPRKNVRFESPPQLSASSSSGSWATSEAESSPTTSYATPLLHRLTTPSEYPCIQTLPHPKPNSTSELSS